MASHKRDTHYDFKLMEVIPMSCSEHALVHNGKQGKQPWFTSQGTLMVLDIFLLGWIQR